MCDSWADKGSQTHNAHTLQEVVNNESLVANIRYTHTISISPIQHLWQHYRYQILIVFWRQGQNYICTTLHHTKQSILIKYLCFCELVKCAMSCASARPKTPPPPPYKLVVRLSFLNMFYTPLIHNCRAEKQQQDTEQIHELQSRIYD